MAKKNSTKKKVPFYYHITAVEDVKSILAEGLKGSTTPRNRGSTFETPSICVLDSDNEKLTDSVAIHQIWPMQDIDQYAVLEISSLGVTGQVVEDNVAESSAPWQRVIKQERIEPRYLKHLRTRSLNFPGETAFLLLNNLLNKRKWTPQEWEIAERCFNGEHVALRRVFEAQQEKRKLTAEEWKHVKPFVHPSVVQDQVAFEAKLDRKKVKKHTPKRKAGEKVDGVFVR